MYVLTEGSNLYRELNQPYALVTLLLRTLLLEIVGIGSHAAIPGSNSVLLVPVIRVRQQFVH